MVMYMIISYLYLRSEVRTVMGDKKSSFLSEELLHFLILTNWIGSQQKQPHIIIITPVHTRAKIHAYLLHYTQYAWYQLTVEKIPSVHWLEFIEIIFQSSYALLTYNNTCYIYAEQWWKACNVRLNYTLAHSYQLYFFSTSEPTRDTKVDAIFGYSTGTYQLWRHCEQKHESQCYNIIN